MSAYKTNRIRKNFKCIYYRVNVNNLEIQIRVILIPLT